MFKFTPLQHASSVRVGLSFPSTKARGAIPYTHTQNITGLPWALGRFLHGQEASPEFAWPCWTRERMLFGSKSQHSERSRGPSGCVEPVALHHPSSPPQAKGRFLHLPRGQNIQQTQPPPYLWSWGRPASSHSAPSSRESCEPRPPRAGGRSRLASGPPPQPTLGSAKSWAPGHPRKIRENQRRRRSCSQKRTQAAFPRLIIRGPTHPSIHPPIRAGGPGGWEPARPPCAPGTWHGAHESCVSL